MWKDNYGQYPEPVDGFSYPTFLFVKCNLDSTEFILERIIEQLFFFI